MARKNHMIGNWKMNQSQADIKNFMETFPTEKFSCETWIAPQFVHIPMLQDLGAAKGINVGAQNCAANEKGAFTGETSPATLKDLGVNFTLIGHSERRAIYGETDSLINTKTKLALSQGLTVVFCCGETLEEREANNTKDVVGSQILNGLKDIDANDLKNVIIAYEPVWAIGTGKTASPEQAEDVHGFIRSLASEKLNFAADDLVILYGGSVKPANVEELLNQANIDGGLVGGASLTGESFGALCKAASSN